MKETERQRKEKEKKNKIEERKEGKWEGRKGGKEERRKKGKQGNTLGKDNHFQELHNLYNAQTQQREKNDNFFWIYTIGGIITPFTVF